MAAVTAQDFQNVMHITTSVTALEYVLDLAIDMLNIYGASLSNMSGGPPKTVTLTSKQRGGVFVIAREVYEKFYKDSATATGFGMSITVIDLLRDTAFVELCETIGKKLTAGTDIPFVIAEDTSGIS